MFKHLRHPSTWFGILIVLSMLLPSLAFAQSGPYTVSDDDLSKKIFIDYLFGPLTGKGDSPLTSIVFIFNSAMLFLGGIFAAYTIIAGTMSTAHDGQMLGQKWSSLWIPIRTTLGAAAIMPVIGGGWCAAQAIVVWLATLGIGIANTMWGAYAADPLSDAVYAPPAMASQVRDTFATMLMNNVCVAAFKTSDDAEAKAGGTVLQSSGSGNTMGVYANSYDGGSGFSYGTADDASSAHANCGKMLFATVANQSPDVGQQDASGAYTSMTGSSLLQATNLAVQILPTQAAQINAAQTAMESLSYRIVNGTATQAEVNSALESQTASYVSAMGSAAQTAYSDSKSNNATFQQQMKKDGWVTAGAFYMSIARAQDQLTSLVTNLPALSSPWDSAIKIDSNSQQGTWSSIKNWFSENWRWQSPTPQLVQESMRRAYSMTQAAKMASSGGVQFATEGASDNNTENGFTNRFLGVFTTGMNGVSAAGANTGFNQNPVIMAKNLGNSMVNWAWSALGAAAAIGFVGTIAASSGSGAFMILAGPFSMLFGVLIVSGASMAYYLPILPFILWIGVVLGWAVLLVEAVIAAPLWAVVHMAPDADGVVGRGGQGYMLVLSLTLRPALMIMGLVAAISLMRPIGYLINSTFAGAFLMAQGPGAGGVTATVAGCAIYAGVMISVINRVFGLIHVIPDRLLRWIGGGGGELGQEAEAINQGSAGKMIAATQGAQQLSKASSDMTGQFAQRRAEMLGRDASNRGAAEQKIGNLNDQVSRQDAQAGKADTKAMNNASGDGDQAARQEGNSLMAAGLRAAREQAGITQSQGGKNSQGQTTSESKQDFSAAQEFMADYDEAKENGGAGWEAGFVQDQAAKVASKSASEQPSFSRSILSADKGRQQASRPYREARAQNVAAARQAYQPPPAATPETPDADTDGDGAADA